MNAILHGVFILLLSVLYLIHLVHPLSVSQAEETAPMLFRAGGGRRVYLWDNQQITGQILDLNKDTLQLRTAWATRLELPRAAVASIGPLPGWRVVLDEDFRREQKGFTTTGSPAIMDAEDGSSARALWLRSPGQSLTYTLTKPLAAGRVGINFQEREQTRGALWRLELFFQQTERTQRVTVTVAGNGEHYVVDTDGLSGTARQVKRTPGWHRLIIQFRKHSLRLTCDEEILWHNLDEGPNGRLQRVTLRCQQLAENHEVRGVVAWTEFCIERAVDEHPLPLPDAEQDAVCLLDGDQLFGRILHADRHLLQIEGHFGKRSLPWTALASCSFRRPAAGPKANTEAKVRLLVYSGLCAEPDVLEGVVTMQKERRLVLRHPLLGEVILERRRVQELQSFE